MRYDVVNPAGVSTFTCAHGDKLCKTSAGMRGLHCSVVMEKELSKKAKLSIFKTVFVPILTYGHESCIMAERRRSVITSTSV